MIAVLLLLVAQAAVPETETRFVATQDKATTDTILKAAVEQTVAEFSWAVRPMVRPRIEPLVTACPAYRIHVDSSFHVQCEGKDPFVWTVGKTGPWTTPDGDAMTVSLRRNEDRFTLDFHGAEGGKTFIYAFQGETLTVTQKVHSGKLPKPMVWRLDYATRP